MTEKSAIEVLREAAAEFAQIQRAKHYGLWRQDAAPRLTEALAKVEPFRDFLNVWIYTGDGGGVIAATAPFGAWAIDQLIENRTPEETLAAFSAEVERNSANYSNVSPVLGVQIDAPCDLGDGVTLVPEPGDEWASLLHRLPFQELRLPPGTSLLYQRFAVTPAFERGKSSPAPALHELAQGASSVTAPESTQRDAVRKRVRLACLLASAGPVELPLTILRPGQGALFAAGEGNSMAKPFAARPIFCYQVEAAAVMRAFDLLGKFREIERESLTRAIDRLGRARLASSPVDRALELGIAAEIALMHDPSSANSEITYRIGLRAAWLLGRDPAEREAVFSDMRKLYQARSQAAHSGALSSKSTIDLDMADRLVARALSTILERGSFPNWASLTMGDQG